MMNCDEAIERMVDLAQHGQGPSGELALHMAACPECRSNWQVIRAGAAIGQGAAASIDPDRLAGSLLARLSGARRAERRRRGWTLGGVAAAAAAILLAVIPAKRSPTGTATPITTNPAMTATFVVPVSGLDDLDTTELQTVYDQLDGALSGSGSVAAPHVLNSLEG